MGGWAGVVGLDSDRRTDGGLADSRNFQDVQEIIVRSRAACEVNF